MSLCSSFFSARLLPADCFHNESSDWIVLIAISQSPKWRLQFSYFIQPTEPKPRDSSFTVMNDKNTQRILTFSEAGTSKCCLKKDSNDELVITIVDDYFVRNNSKVQMHSSIKATKWKRARWYTHTTVCVSVFPSSTQPQRYSFLTSGWQTALCCADRTKQLNYMRSLAQTGLNSLALLCDFPLPPSPYSCWAVQRFTRPLSHHLMLFNRHTVTDNKLHNAILRLRAYPICFSNQISKTEFPSCYL